MTQEKDINYWKNNCEEDYITTPISVLRYISELEKLVALSQQETMYKENTYKINGNTYITNEEEIKKGDWYLEKAGRQYPILWNGKEKLNFHCKKIILTTDTDLINDGVATLPQQETLYTDEQVREAVRMSRVTNITNVIGGGVKLHTYSYNEIIQLLKHKKDI